ncbi:MAG: ABC transporter ATP-binding protein [Chloroflexota bacterium]
MIRAEGLSKSYSIAGAEPTVALRNVSLDVPEGEFLAIVGPSGAGKSTLLYILSSLEKPDKGSITLGIGGESYRYESMSESALSRFRNKHIGFVFQFHHLLPEFTALENIMMPALIAGAGYRKAEKQAVELIDIVGIGARSHHKPSELSGGEQQRAALARAVINKPSIVFADEPTGNLDSRNAQGALELISRLQREFNLTFVVATHSEEIARAAGRVITMKDGAIV